ncbi:MAG: RNA polymerase sigma factor, partial [Gammaproteobacteria bacterium]|nr:RNA polymerase sigma factor [Gammaproteobacteria bacterium]
MTDIHNDDLAAFREQLVALLPRLRRVARGYTRNVADADDLVQLAIERALLRWQQWQRGTRLDCWMFGILRNAWFDELRARRRHAEVLLEDEQAGTQVAGGDGGQPLQALAVEAA